MCTCSILCFVFCIVFIHLKKSVVFPNAQAINNKSQEKKVTSYILLVVYNVLQIENHITTHTNTEIQMQLDEIFST